MLLKPLSLLLKQIFVLGAGTAVTTLDVALEPGNTKRREAHETRDGKSLPGRAQTVRSTDSNSPASEGEKPVLSLEDANPAWRLQVETRALGCCQRELRWKQGTCPEAGGKGTEWSKPVLAGGILGEQH